MDLSKITKLIPEFTLKDFNMFDIVTHVEWEKALNFESGVEEATFSMTMQSDKGYEVSLKFIKAYSVEVDLCGQIVGFSIEDKIKYGYAPENRYHVSDYENGRIALDCEDILIEKFAKIW